MRTVLMDSKIDAELDSSTTLEFSIVVVVGRPTVGTLLADASAASAPGIFLCGPVSLCDVVWKEVRKENSFLGLTRYCVYDEPFEM